MRIWVILSLLASASFYSLTALAAPCNAGVLPKSIYEKLDKKDYSGAESEAMKAVQAHPDDKQAQFNLAKVYINAALRPAVSLDFQVLGIDKNKTDVSQKLDMSKLKKAMHSDYVVNTEYQKKAEIQIDHVLKRWPESKSLLYCQAKIDFYSRDHEKFLKILHRTAEANADNEKEAVNFLAGYAQKYIKQKNYPYAIDVYTTLLKTYPQDASLLSDLGAAYIYNGKVLKSVSLLDKAYRLAPDDKIIVGDIAEVSMLVGDFAKAERFLKIKAKQRPKDVSVYFDLAVNAMSKGVNNSLPYWDIYFEQNKKHPDGKEWVHAAQVIQKAIKDGSLTIEEQYNLANQFIEGLKTPKYAVPVMTYLQNKYKSEAAFPYQLAHAYDRGGYYDLEENALLETYKRLKVHHSKYIKVPMNEIFYNLARTTYAQGNYKTSLGYLDKMKKGKQEEADTGYMYGLVYLKLGRKDKAREALQLCSKASSSKDLKVSCKAQLKNL